MADDPASPTSTNSVELATELTIAWLSNPNTRVAADDVPGFLQAMHDAVARLAPGDAAPEAVEPETAFTPAVSVRKSLASKDHIISMIDGKPYKTLRRHLAGHGLTPEQYRERYALKSDYPMVAENYSEARRAMAKTIGLGRKPKNAAAPEQTAEASPAAPKRRARAK
ncbi:transcriptional regulator [Sphingomonas sp. ABOLG]|jgi:predicted transcriptional regulator|uniref:MucR family transcriptional regulator n=1 Tax=Sphingomonas sp. ABOLG TaxID=1985880 RepID=UPI000F7E5402|nr:MucR family transcriptional regulator [Sphingomonas sp. ABOLG]RSV13438.1 transcriptional regulator [Sphingomonas sp. ABOLG]